MPHLLAADLAGTDNPALRSTACDACWYLLARGDAHSCHELASRLHQQWLGRLGADHPDTLMMASYLAWALEDLGDRPVGESWAKTNPAPWSPPATWLPPWRS